MMDAAGGRTPDEVTLLLEGSDLYLAGPQSTIDNVLSGLLGPEQVARQRSGMRVAEAGALGSTLTASLVMSEELFRLTPDALEKIAKYGKQITDGGVLQASVRDTGKFAGNLSFQAVPLGPQQALSLQTAAVGMALRTAIADVQASIDAVDAKVSDVQKRVRAREIGEVVGTFRHLQRVVDSTKARGRLLDADWDEVSGARRDVVVALEVLRAYVIETVNAVDAGAALPRRESTVASIADPKKVAGALDLILVAEQSLFLVQYLHVERVRSTEPEHLESVLGEARAALAEQRRLDASLVAAAYERIEAAMVVQPLEVPRIFSIPKLERAVAKALHTIESFATASRCEMPEPPASFTRPALADARREVQRQAITARDGVFDVSKVVGQAATRQAKRATDVARERAGRKSG